MDIGPHTDIDWLVEELLENRRRGPASAGTFLVVFEKVAELSRIVRGHKMFKVSGAVGV
jgi:hypothetical protein